MDARKRQEDPHPDPFPEDFGERLERLIEFAGVSSEEFAERLGIDVDRVMEWREGAVPTGGEVWHIMRLASSVPGGIEFMQAESAGDCRRAEYRHGPRQSEGLVTISNWGFKSQSM